MDKKLEQFRNSLNWHAVSESEKQRYMEIERMILDTEKLPVLQLIARAKKIKPLVRLGRDEDLEYQPKYGDFLATDTLCFCTPCDIRNRSYLYDFNPQKIVKQKGRLMAVPSFHEVGQFTCYHDTGAFYGFLMPSIDEVLQQIPSEIDWLQVDAFELQFPSLDFFEVYDCILDRHVSTVHLYRFDKGLPAKLKGQDVIFEGNRY